MDITLLPPTHILTHHSHLSLLPSALPAGRAPTSSASGSRSRLSLERDSRWIPRAPSDGSCPFSDLPTEIVLNVLSYLELDQLLSVRLVSRRLGQLALSPGLHRQLTLSSLPTLPLPPILTEVILPSARSVELHLFPYPLRAPRCAGQPDTIPSLGTDLRTGRRRRVNLDTDLGAGPPIAHPLDLLCHVRLDQLTALSLPFSAAYLPSATLVTLLGKLGPLITKLDLRGSGLAGSSWTDRVHQLTGLRELDLGFTGITALPRPDQLKRLRVLNIASCSSLSAWSLASFICHLPGSVRYLDLSRLDQIPFEALWNLRVVQRASDCAVVEDEGLGRCRPTQLEEVKVVGIDHLTRRDVRSLKKRWEDQRGDCAGFGVSRHKERDTRELDSVDSWSRHTMAGTKPIDVPHTPRQGMWQYDLDMGSSDLGSPGSSLSASPASPSSLQTPATPPHLAISSLVGTTATRKVELPHHHAFLHALSMGEDGVWDGARLSSGHLLPATSIHNRYTKQERYPTTMEGKVGINIVHSAILESEDEDGYRRFIGEIAGGTLVVDGGRRTDWGTGLDVDHAVSAAHAARPYVEID
ncbi:hypothetical protein IAU60_001269 [Kwoniella sp. DSM 27419]